MISRNETASKKAKFWQSFVRSLKGESFQKIYTNTTVAELLSNATPRDFSFGSKTGKHYSQHKNALLDNYFAGCPQFNKFQINAMYNIFRNLA